MADDLYEQAVLHEHYVIAETLTMICSNAVLAATSAPASSQKMPS